MPKPLAMDTLTANQQLLVATAWVDNRLDPAEATLLRQILGASGLSSPQVDSVLQSRPPSVAALLALIPDGKPREDVMRDVLGMCFSDGVLEIEEFDLIERVAAQLGLDSEDLERIRAEVSSQY